MARVRSGAWAATAAGVIASLLSVSCGGSAVHSEGAPTATPTSRSPRSTSTSVVVTSTSTIAPVVLADFAGRGPGFAVVGLQQVGLEVDLVEEATTTQAAGLVLRTEPAAGQTVPVGTRVRVVVSKWPTVDVPDLVGVEESAALATLGQLGLAARRGDVVLSSTVRAGHLVASEPAPGSTVKVGSEVRYTLSQGAPATVPAVVGFEQGAAASALGAAGLRAVLTGQYDDAVPAGRIIAAAPGAGTVLLAGSPVTLIVSYGRYTGPQQVLVPDVSNLAEAEARARLAALGLAATVSRQPHRTVPVGAVIAHVPGPGTGLLPGASVELVLSSGPAPS